MPRVTGKRIEYKDADLYAYIIGQMKARGMTKKELGELLGLSQQVTSAKLKRRGLTTKELIEVIEILNIDAATVGQLIGGRK
jgi:alkylhydroperoxidase/carboxymuconolactone decarboxylase family protein YurZ